ncbi:MAG: hypothetical protein ACLQVL_31765 [Terriglobia bacterium]
MQSLFGCFAVLGVGFDTLQDDLLDLSLTMAFPIFLVALWSRRIALVGIWLFFVAQWLDTCSVGSPPTLISPFSDWHGTTLFIGVIFFTIAAACDRRSSSKGLLSL